MQWLWFIVGQAVNVLRQAKLVAGSDPEKNKINSMWRWMYRNLIGLVIREVFAIALWSILVHPVAGPMVVGRWLPGYEHFVVFLREIPFLAAPFGMIFSIGGDFAVEKWSWLKAHIPALGD